METMGTRLSSLSMLLRSAILCAFASLGASAQTRIVVDPGKQRQSFEGWGTSLCWWANELGAWKDANLDAMAVLVADTAQGLGMNIYRYNIGGGDAPGHSHMRKFGDMPGFKLTESGPYDWNADARQRKTVSALLKRTRAPILEAFSNSPPWWMTKSGCASGNTDGTNNLKPGYEPAFAAYLVDVVKHLEATDGFRFETLTPFNEPNSNWWKANGKQEGCRFDRPSQPAMIRESGRKLREAGLSGTTLSAADANSIQEMVGNAAAYDSATLAFVSRFNTHSYFGSQADRISMRKVADEKGKKLWQSETGPLSWPGGGQLEVALWSAELILKDLRDMQANAWIDWQVAGGGIWGAIDYNSAAQSCKINKKGSAYAQFMRFIRPGSVLLESNHPGTLAAWSPITATLTLVAVNSGIGSVSFEFEMGGFKSLPPGARVYRTSATEDVARLADVPITGKSLSLAVPESSIVTLVIPGAAVAGIALHESIRPGGKRPGALPYLTQGIGFRFTPEGVPEGGDVLGRVSRNHRNHFGPGFRREFDDPFGPYGSVKK